MSAEFHKSKTFKSAELSKCPFTGAGTPVSYTHLTLPTILRV